MSKCAVALSIGLLALTVAATPLDSLVQQLVNEVSVDSIRATIQRLQDFGTREARTDSNRAAVQYASERLTGYGCDSVYLHHFDTIYGFGPNVIGVKYGELQPEIEYILTGHIDCISDPVDSAPGADDNGSGVAAVLEACRVFAGHWFNYTVRFILGNAEEYTSGLARYVQAARAMGDSIAGALNLDMVGYALDGRDSVFALGKTADPDCSRFLDGFCSSSNAYTGLKVRRILASRDTCFGFEHIYFWMFGYPALTISELTSTPGCHSQGDTIGPHHYVQCGVNDLPMCSEVAKAVVATLATLAQVDGIAGVEESSATERPKALPSVFRGVLRLTDGPDAGAGPVYLLDITGRKVVGLRPGANDVSRLAPGVYFVRAVSRELSAVSCHKVVIQR